VQSDDSIGVRRTGHQRRLNQTLKVHGNAIALPPQPLDRFAVTVTIPSGAAFNSLRWVASSLTGINQISATVEWLSANDTKVTVNTTLPF